MNGTSDIKSILLYKSKSIYSILIFFISVLVRWLLLEQDFLGPPSGQPGHVQVVVVRGQVCGCPVIGSDVDSLVGAGWLFRFIWCHAGFPSVCIRRLLGDVLNIDNIVELVETPDKYGDRKAKDEDSKKRTQTGNNPAGISDCNSVPITNLY